ncbi:MAG: glycine--tRNA ligase subunit beta [Gammaproteobacteria bacterium]
MPDTETFLLEVGTEELPPKNLAGLARALLEQFNDLVLAQALQDPAASTKNRVFFSPRRLAILAPGLHKRQPPRTEERLGPAVQAAFDQSGQPTRAAEGFAKSCGVKVGDLERRQTPKGERLAYRLKIAGEDASELLPQIVRAALAKLPIPKRMRWGTGDAEFVRPVHWVLMRFGSQVLHTEILGVHSGGVTYGHRYQHPGAITLERPQDYRRTLATRGKVLVEDLDGTLAARIRRLVEAAARRAQGIAQIDADLLAETAALVEWPVALSASFAAGFLALPGEVVEAVLQTQQRYFPLRDPQGHLLPKFVLICNIRSKRPDEVRRGNERVIVPRLDDAMFFWNSDRKLALEARRAELARVVFQKELGSYADKSQRVAALAADIAAAMGSDAQRARRAGELCKTDLVTGMVGEFPELQGVMGGYYARHDGETAEVARAIAEHYRPRHSGDALPTDPTGQALAIADKLDTLAGIFAIGAKPSGDKDPYGLRRAGLGVMRILVEGQRNLDLAALIGAALGRQAVRQAPPAIAGEIFDFLVERLRSYYLERGVRGDVFEAVRARRPQRPLDFHRRVLAVNEFMHLPEAASLAAANKRIANILKQAGALDPTPLDSVSLRTPAESALQAQVEALDRDIQPQLAAGDYAAALSRLAALRAPVDTFFEEVLVLDPDPKVRAHRLTLLAHLSSLFLHTADLALIQS